MLSQNKTLPGLSFFFLFKTSAPDGSSFFGIHRDSNISWGTDGNPVSYIGRGPKLQAKVRQFGIARMTVEVLHVDPDYATICKRLDAILTPATLADPRCLNMPRPETNAKIAETLSGQSKSAEHKAAIGLSMAGNQNAVKNEVINNLAIRRQFAGDLPADIFTTPNDTQNGPQSGTMQWIHNKSTGEEMQIEPDEDLLEGFESGRLPAEHKSKFKKDRKKVMSDADRAKLIRD